MKRFSAILIVLTMTMASLIPAFAETATDIIYPDAVFTVTDKEVS